MIAPILTPHGRLHLAETNESASTLEPGLAQRLTDAFAQGQGHGLLQLGAAEVQTVMPAVFAYWREFAARFVIAVRTFSTLPASIPAPPEAELQPQVLAPPVMTGAEYLSSSVLTALWADIDAAFRQELSESQLSVEDFLKQKNPAWNLVGRVHFNLAENRKDDESPFAFLATYTHRLSTKPEPKRLLKAENLSELFEIDIVDTKRRRR